jgi:hypothetical protein
VIVCSYSLPKNGVYYFFSFARRTRKENCSAQVHDLQKNENAAEIALKQLSEPVSLVRFFVHSHLMSRVPKTDLCRKNHMIGGIPQSLGNSHHHITGFSPASSLRSFSQTERKSPNANPTTSLVFLLNSHNFSTLNHTNFKKHQQNNTKHQQTIDIPHHDSFLSP